MKLVEIPVCPVSGEAGDVAVESVSDAFFGTPGHWRYRKNRRTGHLWLDPRPAAEDIGELYTTYYTHDGAAAPPTLSVWQQALSFALARRLGYPIRGDIRQIAKLISFLPSVADAAELEMMRVSASQSGALLDVGCGGGALLERMRDAGWQVVGTEPDPNAAARLRDRLGFPVFGSVDELVDRPEQFDLITLGHVIEHVPDPTATLRQLATLLKPGGRLVVTTPNVDGLGARIFGNAWRGLEPPRHFNVFTPQSMAETFRQSGFRVIRLSTHARLARGIFYVSAMAKRGHSEIESRRTRQDRLLTVAGYLFQLLETAAIRLMPAAGEEIYCEATLLPPPGQTE
ncbi:MAG TPA: class I SAM-dependent methyltransferase [Burkholderiaceae bacterium]